MRAGHKELSRGQLGAHEKRFRLCLNRGLSGVSMGGRTRMKIARSSSRAPDERGESARVEICRYRLAVRRGAALVLRPGGMTTEQGRAGHDAETNDNCQQLATFCYIKRYAFQARLGLSSLARLRATGVNQVHACPFSGLPS